MRLINERILFSTSDLVNHQGCAHRTTLELARMRGELALQAVRDPMREMLSARGAAHEHDYLEMLADRGLEMVYIESGHGDLAALEAAAAATEAAMAAGADVIAQAVFLHDGWTARPDVLLRIERHTTLGDHGYEVVDTKLARHGGDTYDLQVWDYSQHVARIQGVMPQSAQLVLGDGTTLVVDLAQVIERLNPEALRRLLLRRAIHEDETYPDPVEACKQCPWLPLCGLRRTEDDDLVQLPNIRATQRRTLMEAGIRTVADLAGYEPDHLPGIGDNPLSKLRRHARLQVRARQEGHPVLELLPSEPGHGMALLPEPRPGDLFIDFESDLWWGEGGLEYMLGFVAAPDGEPVFDVLWAHDREQERLLYSMAVDRVMAAWRSDPQVHVYHYGAYEVSAFTRLEARHGERTLELQQLKDTAVFVNLQSVVQGGLCTSLKGYSLKDIEHFFMEDRQGDVVSAGASLVAYEDAIASSDPLKRQQMLDAIEDYNRVDCITTLKLRDWLVGLREAEPASRA